MKENMQRRMLGQEEISISSSDLLWRPLKKKKKNTSSFGFLNENFVLCV